MNPVRHRTRIGALAVLVAWIFVISWMLGVATRADAASSDEAAPPAPAPRLEERRSTPQTTFETVGSTVMCPSCDTTLDQSNSPAAERMRIWVQAAIAAGWTEEEIRDGLVQEYGGDESILAVPRAQGLGLGIWIVPGIVVFAMLVGGALLLRRWRRPAQETGSVSQSTDSSSSEASASSNSDSST